MREQRLSFEAFQMSERASEDSLKKMYITAADVGAVPQRLNPEELRLLPSSEFKTPPDVSTRKLLADAGWKEYKEQGLLLVIPEGTSPCIERQYLENLPTEQDKQKVVLGLGEQGWVFDSLGDMVWPYKKGCSYINPELLKRVKKAPKLLEHLRWKGWTKAEPGWWRTGPIFSPHIPVDTPSMIADGLECAKQGAAIVHFHTRAIEPNYYPVDGIGLVDLSRQPNKIREEEFQKIIEAFTQESPKTILNFSTSARGNVAESSKNDRYIHMWMTPDIGSMSNGGVFFAAGGGYYNEPGFLDCLRTEMREYGVRPEQEIFSRTMLANILDGYDGRRPESGHEIDRVLIVGSGSPQLLMLVVGVDQSTEFRQPGEKNGDDDSLIKAKDIAFIRTNLEGATEEGRNAAIDQTCKSLRPIVGAIRSGFPEGKISILMSGILSSIAVDVACRLDLDGIRTGMEDALTVRDPTVPGGVRKARSSAEQVMAVKDELLQHGVEIYTSEELRRDLNFRPEIGYVRPDLRWKACAAQTFDPHAVLGCKAMELCMSGSTCQFDQALVKMAEKELCLSRNPELSVTANRDLNRLRRYNKLED